MVLAHTRPYLYAYKQVIRTAIFLYWLVSQMSHRPELDSLLINPNCFFMFYTNPYELLPLVYILPDPNIKLVN